MAFGSGNNNSSSSSSKNHHHHHHHHGHQQPPHHHHHHNLHLQHVTSSSSSSSSPQQQQHHQSTINSSQSSTPQGAAGGSAQGGSLASPIGSSGGAGNPNILPLPSKSYYDSGNPDPMIPPYNNVFMFPPTTRGSKASAGNSGNNSSSGNASKFTHHHHHHHQQQQQQQRGYSPFIGPGGGRGDEGDSFFPNSSAMQQYNQPNFITGATNQQHNTRDLNPNERVLLDQIRARKAELLQEIAQLQDEIDNVSHELLYTQKEEPPPPDLISRAGPGILSGPAATSALTVPSGPPTTDVPLADGETDNLSEHSEHDHAFIDRGGSRDPSGVIITSNSGTTKIPSNTVLGSNSSTTSSNSSKEKDRLKAMSLGCKKFNMDPKKGIESLVENGLLKKDDEQDIAMFLYRGEGLNKTAIGDYLGERSPVNERVLKSFVSLHDFTDLILVQALRQFLWSFRLPGEAQKIDRMMECFAQRYCHNNPDIFTNTDTCYVLSFAIIMLNTSLHNPSVKDKPTIETFISMNRGINNGGDLPRELLISLYNSIQSEPFKIPEDDGNDLMHTFFNPDKEGWLWKQGGRYKTWKRRWFILNDNCLYYFEFTTDKEPRGIIPLENVGVREIEDSSSSKSRQRYCFELFATDGSEVIKACKTDSDGRVVEGKHSVYRMSAANAEERDSWVKALRQSISYSPFYEILRKTGASNNSTSSLRTGAGGSNTTNNTGGGGGRNHLRE